MSLCRRWIFLAGSLLVSAVPSASLLAATINVVPDGVAGCDLRRAVVAANSDSSSSSCSAGSGTDTLVLQHFSGRPIFTLGGVVSGDVNVTSPIIIQGINPEQAIIVALQFDRAFDVQSPGSLTLNDVTVIGGSVIGASDNENDGGVVRKGPGAALTINRSVLRGGNAEEGGAIYAVSTGVLTLDKVTLMGNSAAFGGGIALDQPTGVEAILNNVTISGNTASARGGGLFVRSGFRMRNSTIARNRASSGGGGVDYSDTTNNSGVNFANSLLHENFSGIANPSDLNCSVPIQLGTRNHSLIGAISNCTFVNSSNNPISNEARLSPLFDFGSGVPVHALLSGSAALFAGNPSSANPLTACLISDARGVPRSTSCDLGAYQQRFDVSVDSFNDLPDLNPGDGQCQALGNACTLRAAVMEGSASRGRWFVGLPAGTYTLSRALNLVDDSDGGDLDVYNQDDDLPFQMTLMGFRDADDTRIVGGGVDRVLEVRGRSAQLNPLLFSHHPLAFALLNVTVSGGVLRQDPFEPIPNSTLDGGGIRVIGAKSLFYNVIVKDNYIASLQENQGVRGGGLAIDVQRRNTTVSQPYAASAHMERFSVVDNDTSDVAGEFGEVGGGLNIASDQPGVITDGVTMINGVIAGNDSFQVGGVNLSGKVAASFLSIINNTSGPLAPPGSTQYAAGLMLSGQNNAVRNVLIAGNTAGGVSSDCEVNSSGAATLVSLGYNLIATAGSGCVISGDTTSNLLNVDPQLGPRQLSTGGMAVYQPAASSPAVDVIPRSVCVDNAGFVVTADVQGVLRTGSSSTLCDIGAVEIELPLFASGFE